MFRLWGKVYIDSKIIKDIVICDERNLPRTELIESALTEICMTFDLQKPLWLQDNVKDIKQFRRCLFKKDHFIEQIDFDYLEIEIIEEDNENGRLN